MAPTSLPSAAAIADFRKMLTRRQRQTLLPQSPLDDPALLAPLFAALPARSLVNAAQVCKAWSAAEQLDRAALWKRIVLQQYPALAAVARPGSDFGCLCTIQNQGARTLEHRQLRNMIPSAVPVPYVSSEGCLRHG